MPTKRYGYSITKWNQAKDEMRNLLIKYAKSGIGLPTYSAIAANLTTIKFEPEDYGLAAMLGELSEAEDDSGRGMISSLVVSKQGGRPGQGFFELAACRGKKVNPEDDTSKDIFWIAEVNKVQQTWKNKSKSKA